MKKGGIYSHFFYEIYLLYNGNIPRSGNAPHSIPPLQFQAHSRSLQEEAVLPAPEPPAVSASSVLQNSLEQDHAGQHMSPDSEFCLWALVPRRLSEPTCQADTSSSVYKNHNFPIPNQDTSQITLGSLFGTRGQFRCYNIIVWND